jgi:enediyne biosynthesis protein E4
MVWLACSPPTETDVDIVSFSCEHPEERADLGPMFLWSDPSWDAQQVQEEAPHGQDGGWGVAVDDFDDDGWLDIFLPHHGDNELFMGGPDGWSNESISRLPAGANTYSQGAVAVDLEDDGDVDIIVVGPTDSVFLVNDGDGVFTRVPVGHENDQRSDSYYSAALGDFDGDLDLDLLLPNFAHGEGYEADPETGERSDGRPSRLLENQGGLFSDVSHLLPDTNRGYPFVGSWTDHDGDGDLDIYLPNDHGDLVIGNRMWKNEGGTFTDVSGTTGTDLKMSSMGIGIGDLNDDGRPDYLITGEEVLRLLESQEDGRWVETSYVRGLELDRTTGREVGWGAELADMNNDGLLDAVVSFGHWPPRPGNPLQQPDALYLFDGTTFTQSAERYGLDDMGQGRGFALADLNNDGWLDVVKRELFGPARIYLSRCDDRAWLRVRVRTDGPNNRQIGAHVVVESEGVEQHRWVVAGSTSLSSGGPAEVHFGLGDADFVNLTVVLTDGETLYFDDVETRQVLTVSP